MADGPDTNNWRIQKTPNPKDFKTLAEYEAACARQREGWRKGYRHDGTAPAAPVAKAP